MNACNLKTCGLRKIYNIYDSNKHLQAKNYKIKKI